MDNTLDNIRKQIDAYVKGILSEDQIMDLWTEFAKNPSLLEELELEVSVKELLNERLEDKEQKQTGSIKRLPSWAWHATAAAVLFLVLSIQLFQNETRTEIDQFTLSMISPDQLEASNGVRSDMGTSLQADSLLDLGFSAMLSGNREQALSLYDQVISEFDEEPFGSKAYTNKGILLYNEGEYAEAILAFDNALERIVDNRMVEEKAYWFKANALVKLGQLEEALEPALNTYNLEGVFSESSFLLIKKLNYDLGMNDPAPAEETDN